MPTGRTLRRAVLIIAAAGSLAVFSVSSAGARTRGHGRTGARAVGNRGSRYI